MLSYIVTASRQLMSLAIILALVFAFVDKNYEDRMKKVMRAGVAIGVIAAAVMSYMKNATNMIDTGYWNLRIFITSLAALVLFFIFFGLRKKLGKAGSMLSMLMLTIETALLLFYVLPDAIAYPYTLYVSETTVFTSSYIIKFGGILIALALVIVAFLAVKFTADRVEDGKVFAVLAVSLIANNVKQIFQSFSIMMAKRIIANNHSLFVLVKYSSNYSDVYTYICMIAVTILCIMLWMRSFHVNEPYSNPAQHRKIRAKWRSIRRWATTAMVCFVLGVVTFTAIEAYTNKKVELSPTEEPAQVDDEWIYVSFDQVSDGHLHRFGYTTEDGTQLRIIIIQKPNSSSYGIGMDACDICGETGYYEKDGQVICNRCDVVMNINTIGFKGGCNPKIVDYQISNGMIMVSIESMCQYEHDFQ